MRNDVLARARTLSAAGDVAGAARECERVLAGQPRHVEARHLLARCLLQAGRTEEAIGRYRALLGEAPELVPALADLAFALLQRQEFAAARPLFERAVRLNPGFAPLHLGLGISRLESGDTPGAIAALEAALARDAGLADARLHLGLALERAGEGARAVACYADLIARDPGYLAARRALGDLYLRQGDPLAAAAALGPLAERSPTDALAHADLGLARLLAGDAEAAVPALERALAIDPSLATTATNLGEARRRLGDLLAAARSYGHALGINPRHEPALLGLALTAADPQGGAAAGDLLVRIVAQAPPAAAVAVTLAHELERAGRSDAALAVAQAALRGAPGDAGLWIATGAIRHRRRELKAARDCYRQALSLDAARLEAHVQLAQAEESLGDYVAAGAAAAAALALGPHDRRALAVAYSCGVRLCDWATAEAALAQLRGATDAIDELHPFLLLTTDLDPAERAQSLARRAAYWRRDPVTLPRPSGHGPLRVAYLSPDFRDHPVAHALIGLIESHDRAVVQPLGVALSAPDASPVAARLRRGFDEFLDVSERTDAEIVAELRRRSIDVAIDLAGFTVGARTEVFAQRVAPVQIGYLGYPGSLGLECLDYLVADPVVVPPTDEPWYSERIVRMPSCYLPFDQTRIAAGITGRDEAGLPADGVVYCAFNSGYKITRAVFGVWLDVLEAVPRSVLWLRRGGEGMEARLRQAAHARGIDPGRLVYAPFVADHAAHLARLSCADLFLDTTPYNAHTTGAEALWAGVPVLTCVGRSFAGRVGESLLRACGLGDLVQPDLDAYRRCAVEAGRSPALRARWRAQVDAARRDAPAFDTLRYARDFESLLVHAVRDP